MPTKRTIETVYTASIDQFVAGTRKASGELSKFEKQSVKSGKALRTAFKVGGVVTAGVAAAVGIMESLSASVDVSTAALDNLGKASRRLGLTTDELQELRILAGAAGVETQSLDTAFQRFARRIGQGSLDKPFKELGITLKNSQGDLKTNIQLWEEYGRKISELDDENRQLALTMAAVDTEGVKIVELWRMTGDEIDAVKEKMREYGLVLDEEVIVAAEEYQTQLGLINKAHEVMGQAIDSQLAPLALAWQEIKLEIAQATVRLAEFAGIVNKTGERRFNELFEQRYELLQKIQRIESDPLDAFAAERAAPYREELEKINAEMEKLRNNNVARIEASAARSDPGSSGPTGAPGAPDTGGSRGSGSSRRAKQIKEVGQAYKDATGPASVYYDLEKRAAQIYESTRTPLENHVENMKELQSLLQTGLIDPETASRAAKASVDTLDIVQEKTEELAESWDDLGYTFESAFENAVLKAGSLKEIVNSLGDDIQRVLLRRLFTEPLGNAASGLASNLAGNLFGGFRADGGPVAAGSAYVVGESGPELFVPSNSGAIVPNGGGATIVQNFQVMPGMDPGSFARSARQGAVSAGRLLETGRSIS